jgi:hypothetical protein
MGANPVVAKRNTKFSYTLFCSIEKPVSFWRWEVFDLSTKIICAAGFLYGTRRDAAATATNAIARLGSSGSPDNKRGIGSAVTSRGSKRTKR